jgi:hypothetical protein
MKRQAITSADGRNTGSHSIADAKNQQVLVPACCCMLSLVTLLPEVLTLLLETGLGAHETILLDADAHS